ncbi:DnaJ domain-containing protein, partial [Ochromonadaceae sp. CCMP2298]
YAALGVGKDASLQEIKRSFRKLAQKHHPDKVKEQTEDHEEAFRSIAEAYEVLSSKDGRREYDNKRTNRAYMRKNRDHMDPYNSGNGYGEYAYNEPQYGTQH